MAKKKAQNNKTENARLQIRFVDDDSNEKEEVKEVEAKAVEIVEELPIEELPVEKEEEVEEPKEEEEAEEAPLQEVKPPKYYHVDQFLQTAIPMFGLNAMQARGFKSRMQGRQYQTDMFVFMGELKKYLNIK